MIPGVVAGGAPLTANPIALWTPLNMAVVPQVYLDAQDSVVTDVAGACSAISNLGAMGVSGDFLQSTAANRPAILAGELNSKRALRFDGVDDVLLGASAQQKAIFQNKPAAWLFLVYKKRTADPSPALRNLFYSTVGGGAAARFAVYAGLSTVGNANTPNMQVRRLDADPVGALAAAAASSGAYVMALHRTDYSAGVGTIEIDGGPPITNLAITSTGNTSNTPAQEALSIGAFYNAGGATDADIASVVVSCEAPSLGDIDRLFGWAAHKYGLAASLPGAHPYKTAAPTV